MNERSRAEIVREIYVAVFNQRRPDALYAMLAERIQSVGVDILGPVKGWPRRGQRFYPRADVQEAVSRFIAAHGNVEVTVDSIETDQNSVTVQWSAHESDDVRSPSVALPDEEIATSGIDRFVFDEGMIVAILSEQVDEPGYPDDREDDDAATDEGGPIKSWGSSEDDVAEDSDGGGPVNPYGDPAPKGPIKSWP